jgi:hypothetical protein
MIFLRQCSYPRYERNGRSEARMIIAVHNMTIGVADAGRQARAVLTARGFGKGRTLPTFRLLRS